MPSGTNTYTYMHAQELIPHKFSLVHIDQNRIIMLTLFSLSFLLELSFPWEFSIYACDNVVLALRHTKLNDFLFFLFSCFPLFIALAENLFRLFLPTKKFLHIFIAFYIWVMMPQQHTHIVHQFSYAIQTIYYRCIYGITRMLTVISTFYTWKSN